MKDNCKIPGCQRKKNFKSMCLVHARQNLDPATFQSLYHAIKGCREPGCKKLHMIRYFCMKHARQNLEPRLFEELTMSFKWCKDSDCKKRVGARGRNGFCELHKTPLPSAAAMNSVSAIKHRAVSRERTDLRTGSGDGDDDSTVVDTASKDDRAAPPIQVVVTSNDAGKCGYTSHCEEKIFCDIVWGLLRKFFSLIDNHFF